MYSSKQYSRLGSANFGSQCTNFQLEFFDDLNFFGILTYHIHNEILILEGFDQFYCWLILAFFWFIWGQNDKKQNWSDCFKIKILLWIWYVRIPKILRSSKNSNWKWVHWLPKLADPYLLYCTLLYLYSKTLNAKVEH